MKKQKTSAKNSNRSAKPPKAAQMKAYEASAADKAADRKSGTREGSAKDRKQDVAGAKALFQQGGRGTAINQSPPVTLVSGKKSPALRKGGAGAY